MAIKIKKEFYIKFPIIIIYLLPFIAAYFRNETVGFSKIYYVGLVIAFLSLFNFKNELVNNWIFTLAILFFPVSLIMIIAYFSM